MGFPLKNKKTLQLLMHLKKTLIESGAKSIYMDLKQRKYG